jgi:galactose mutarotase-like enzyme
MNSLINTPGVRHVQGFAARVLANETVELVSVPELGAKIVSLKNLRTGREWLWHPHDTLHLFRNAAHDDFSLSPLAGVDECLPTILPCAWQGRPLPDHGEVWSQPWQVDEEAWQNGLLTTSINLKISPLKFRRTIELAGNEVRIDYKLINLSPGEERFVWAFHPLLRLSAGDELVLPESTRELLQGHSWIQSVSSVIPERKCAKVFARPISDGSAAIENKAQGDRLEFLWNAGEFNVLGLWLTRGGWHGHHHFAIEPTNADHHDCCGLIAGHSSASWQIQLRVGL